MKKQTTEPDQDSDIVWCRHEYPAESCPFCKTIEECAQLVDQYDMMGWDDLPKVAAAIRGLKDKP